MERYLLLADTKNPFNRDIAVFFIYGSFNNKVYYIEGKHASDTEWEDLETLAEFAKGNGWNYNVVHHFNDWSELKDILYSYKILNELVT